MKSILPVLAVLALATAASAQNQAPDPVGDLLRQDGAVGSPNVYDGPADETPRDPYDPELAVTAGLNAEIAARDRDIEAANARADADYRAQEDDYVRRVQQQQADHAAAQAAYEEAVARQRAEHGAAMARWRRCADGDRTACDPAPLY